MSGYQQLLEFLQVNGLSSRLFLVSVELCLLVALATAASCLLRSKYPRLTATLWVVVLLKPIFSFCLGSPITIHEFSSMKTTALAMVSDADDTLNQGARVDLLGSLPSQLIDAPFNRVERTVQDTTNNPCLVESERGRQSSAFSERAESKRGRWAVAKGDWISQNVTELIVLFWLAGVILFSFIWALRQFRLHWIVRNSMPANGELSAVYDQVVEELRLTRCPKLKMTNGLDSPAIAGLFWPVILIPRWLCERKNSAALRWSLKHEINHWRVGDLISNSICAICSCLFFFHPLVWWASRQWRFTMELACDRDLLESETDAVDYLDALWVILQNVKRERRMEMAGSLFASRTQIGRRIQILLGWQSDLSARPGKVVIVAFSAIFALVLLSGDQSCGFSSSRQHDVETDLVERSGWNPSRR